MCGNFKGIIALGLWTLFFVILTPLKSKKNKTLQLIIFVFLPLGICHPKIPLAIYRKIPQHYVFIKLKINCVRLKRSLKALKDKATKVYSQELS